MSGTGVAAPMALTLNDKLNYLLDKGHATDAYIQWGRGKRNVIIIGGKKYQYKKGKIFSLLQNKIIHALYSSVSESLNTNTETDVMSKYNKAEHQVQVIYELTETNKNTNKTTTREYNSYSFPVTGGKMKIRKAIEEKTKEIHDTLNEKYESTLDEFKIKRLYIDEKTGFRRIKKY
jgi:DNA-binding HxlR family transcriptional regulator